MQSDAAGLFYLLFFSIESIENWAVRGLRSDGDRVAVHGMRSDGDRVAIVLR